MLILPKIKEKNKESEGTGGEVDRWLRGRRENSLGGNMQNKKGSSFYVSHVGQGRKVLF
jgi:hypothetical protein